MGDTDKAIEAIKAAMEKEEKDKKNDKSTQQCVEKQAIDDNNVTQEDKDMNISQDEEEVSEKQSTKSFLKSSKSKELAAKEEKINELSDRLIRTMAEFDNFRKRSEKEKSQMFDIGAKSVLEKLLPVIDNFERGLDSISEEDKDNSFVQGFNMIYKQLITTMDEIGVKAIEAVNNEFDPNFHNAVMHSEDESLGENIVAEEFQKGYMYRDFVIRHSMVRVVN